MWIKIKDEKNPSKVQGKWKYKKTQPKEKTKANNQQNKIKSDKDPMQRGLTTTKWQSMITKKTFSVRGVDWLMGEDKSPPKVVGRKLGWGRDNLVSWEQLMCWTPYVGP
jgi:hypothetical protein